MFKHPIFGIKERCGMSMSKKYIRYCEKNVYLIYSRGTKTMYYNLDFIGLTQLILVI